VKWGVQLEDEVIKKSKCCVVQVEEHGCETVEESY
jgi:hypothetical protein